MNNKTKILNEIKISYEFMNEPFKTKEQIENVLVYYYLISYWLNLTTYKEQSLNIY